VPFPRRRESIFKKFETYQAFTKLSIFDNLYGQANQATKEGIKMKLEVGRLISYRWKGIYHEGIIRSVSVSQRANRRLKRPQLLSLDVDLSHPTHATDSIVVNPATNRCRAQCYNKMTGRIL
jgi:hypothetical protein